EPPDARLRRQERVRVGALVPRTFRVHPEDRADVLAVQLLDAALEHVVVEPALFPRAHDRRGHPHAAPRAGHERAERVVVEEGLAYRKEDAFREARAPVKDRGDAEKIEERAVVRDEENAVLLSEALDDVEAVDVEATAPAGPDERAHHDRVVSRRE